jgi:nitrite reductase/ring-hydroxylating ferredoxin subunit
MKSATLPLVLLLLLTQACRKKDNLDPSCNFLLDIGVNEVVNMNLPQYNNLLFTSNSVFVSSAANSGLIVVNVGTGYLAWDAADPNHVPNSCGTLAIDGVLGVCGCDDGNTYSLFTGQPMENPDLRCALKSYPVTRSDNTLYISN